MALIARWRFEPGNLFVDSSGNSNTLATAGGVADPTSDTSWKVDGAGSGKFWRATGAQRAWITDANQSAGFPCRDADASPVTTFTICGWYKTGELTQVGGICNKWSTTAAERCFTIWFDGVTLKKIHFNVRDLSGNERDRTHQTVLADNTVYFFSVAFNDDTGDYYIILRNIYANAIGSDLSGTVGTPWDGLNSTDVAFFVGAHAGENNQINGWLDDLRIYSGEYLSIARATQICRQSSGLAGRRLMMGG